MNATKEKIDQIAQDGMAGSNDCCAFASITRGEKKTYVSIGLVDVIRSNGTYGCRKGGWEINPNTPEYRELTDREIGEMLSEATAVSIGLANVTNAETGTTSPIVFGRSYCEIIGDSVHYYTTVDTRPKHGVHRRKSFSTFTAAYEDGLDCARADRLYGRPALAGPNVWLGASGIHDKE